jgi:hypothetical protein
VAWRRRSGTGSATSSTVATGVTGYSAQTIPTASAPPTAWAAMKLQTDEGAMPAKVFENIRPTVIAGLAKLADDVKK